MRRSSRDNEVRNKGGSGVRGRGCAAGVFLLLSSILAAATGCPARGARNPRTASLPPPGTVAPPTGPSSAEVEVSRARVAAMLGEAERIFQEMLDIDQARTALDEALGVARSAGLTDPVAARVCALRGVIHLWMGEQDAADALFALAVGFDRGVVIPENWSGPDVREAMERAHAAVPVGPPPGPAPGASLRHTPPPGQVWSHAVPIFVEIDPAVPVASVVLYHRSGAFPGGDAVAMFPVGPGWYGEIPCGPPGPDVVEYFVQGIDRAGNVVVSAGGPEASFRLSVVDPASTPPFPRPDGNPPTFCAR